jgi:hypothetical protein
MGKFCLIMRSFFNLLYLLMFVFILLSITGTVLLIIMVHTVTIPFAVVVLMNTEEKGVVVAKDG